MKSNHHNIDIVKKTKKLISKISNQSEKIHTSEYVFLGEYYNLFTRMMSPITKRFLEEEYSKIMEWAQDENSLRMVDYIDFRGYTPETYYEWVKKYPEIKIAHEFALRRIGSRREQGAMIRKFSEGTIHRTLGYYDTIFASETQKLAQMKEDSTPDIKLIIENFPSPSEHHKTPEEIAANIRRNTATARQVKVNSNVGAYHAQD